MIVDDFCGNEKSARTAVGCEHSVVDLRLLDMTPHVRGIDVSQNRVGCHGVVHDRTRIESRTLIEVKVPDAWMLLKMPAVDHGHVPTLGGENHGRDLPLVVDQEFAWRLFIPHQRGSCPRSCVQKRNVLIVPFEQEGYAGMLFVG